MLHLNLQDALPVLPGLEEILGGAHHTSFNSPKSNAMPNTFDPDAGGTLLAVLLNL